MPDGLQSVIELFESGDPVYVWSPWLGRWVEVTFPEPRERKVTDYKES